MTLTILITVWLLIMYYLMFNILRMLCRTVLVCVCNFYDLVFVVSMSIIVFNHLTNIIGEKCDANLQKIHVAQLS